MKPHDPETCTKHKHHFDTPLEAAEYSLKRASEVQHEPLGGDGWPDPHVRAEFSLALLTDAVRHLIDHVKGAGDR